MNVLYARAPDDQPQYLEDQIARCQARAKVRGVHVDPGSIYTDGGDSGSAEDRIGLRTLIQGVENGDISAVYVDTLGCFGNLTPVMNMMERWLRKGVEVIVATQDEALSQGARKLSLGTGA